MAHQFKQPTPIRELNPDVPHELVAVVERLMQKTPEARYGGISEVVEVLRTLANPLVRATAAPSPAQRRRPARDPDPRFLDRQPADGKRPGAAAAGPAADDEPAAHTPRPPPRRR